MITLVLDIRYIFYARPLLSPHPCSTLQYPDSQVNKLEITTDKRLLAAAGNPDIRIFDVNSNNAQPVHSCDGHTDNVTSIGFHKDNGWLYSGSEDGTVRLWDIRAPGSQREFESRAAVNSVVLHPNQNELISADQNGNIRVWDITAGSCSCELVPEVGVAVRSLSVAADGSLLVASNSHGTCYVWRSVKSSSSHSTFEPLHRLKGEGLHRLSPPRSHATPPLPSMCPPPHRESTQSHFASYPNVQIP